MLKFIRGHSAQSSTSSKLSTSSSTTSNKPNNEIDENNYSNKTKFNGLTYDPNTGKILLELKLNSVLHRKLIAKLSRKKLVTNINQTKFQKGTSSLNSSCNDSEISCSGESSISRCTSSCGERSSVSELDISCSTSDNEDLTKISTINNVTKIETNLENSSITNDLIKEDHNLSVIKKDQLTNESFKTESKRRSILLSNQVTKSKSSLSISTAAPKLLLPKDVSDVSDNYDCSRSMEKMVKFFTYSLREDVEYKTLSISKDTTSKQVIKILLDKFKMKHRDSNLFYVTMEIIIRKNGIPVRSAIVLNDEACPAQLKACYPNSNDNEIRFVVQSKPGGLVKIYDSCLMAGSLYKSIIIDLSTTVNELIQLTLNCYQSKDKASNYSLFVVSKTGSYQLSGEELPLYVQKDWNTKEEPIFQLRKIKEVNYNYLNKTFLFKTFSSISSNGISFQIFRDHFYI